MITIKNPVFETIKTDKDKIVAEICDCNDDSTCMFHEEMNILEEKIDGLARKIDDLYDLIYDLARNRYR